MGGQVLLVPACLVFPFLFGVLGATLLAPVIIYI
jgi:hypothetical protein